MKIAQAVLSVSTLMLFTCSTLADTLVLKNGDHLTGTIESSDATVITFKTDYAGEIKVQWSAVNETSTERREKGRKDGQRERDQRGRERRSAHCKRGQH